MPLALGELWAIPIMLRLALIENLRRVASRAMANWDDRNMADAHILVTSTGLRPVFEIAQTS
jgi:hypothetical protein